jgi:hypothetical protein
MNADNRDEVSGKMVLKFDLELLPDALMERVAYWGHQWVQTNITATLSNWILLGINPQRWTTSAHARTIPLDGRCRDSRNR